MILPTELTGGDGDTEHPSRGLYFAVLGATVAKGRPITQQVRTLAETFRMANVSDAEPEVIAAILIELHLDPDEVLPPDDDDLGRVIDLGRLADRASR